MAATDPKRLSRLQQTVTAASWWMLGQGLLYTFLGPRLAALLRLRFQDIMVPYIELAGIALLCLGLFVNRAVREANRQYLAVDSLVLFFLGLATLTIHGRILGFDVFWFEWFSFAVNLSLASTLIVYRTKGSEMQVPPGSLVALDALKVLEQGSAWIKTKSNKSETSSDVRPELNDVAIPEKEEKVATKVPPPKTSSQALPHMD